jgi:phage terminase Nu1 subunit (DNA packaging protein)
MSNGHGGYRQGAGRRPADYQPTQDAADLATAKARNEAAKADLNELELRVKSGEYVSRTAVREATATALATLAQTLRSVPDNLERELNIDPELADEIGKRIDAALDEVADEFEKLGTDPEALGDDLVVSGDEDDASDLL